MPLETEPNESRQQAVDALHELILAGEAFRQSIATHLGIGRTDALAISYLVSRGDLGQTELAALLARTTSSVTSLIDRLESGGFARRVPDPEDRRRAVVRLTDRGLQAVAESQRWFAGAFDRMPDRELPYLTQLLRGLAEGLRERTLTIPKPAADSARPDLDDTLP